MKIGFALVALALTSLGLGASPASNAEAGDDPASNVTLAATRAAGKVSIKLTPAASWYINSDYPIKCTLTIAAGGTLEKAELVKADATFTASGKEGKAKDASFSVGADKEVSGECKLVICSDTSCSPPFKLPVKSN